MKSKIVLLLLTAWWPLSMLADKWPPPRVQDYYSSDRNYFVRVFPRTVPEKYYKWQQAAPKQKRRFSAQDTVIVPCYAVLFARTGSSPRMIWRQNLVNQVAPVEAMVSDDGKYVVTFNNHHSVGYGQDVMVVYNHQGSLLRQYNLEQISPFPLNRYLASRSSIWWQCKTSLVEAGKLKLCFVTRDSVTQSKVYSLAKLDFE
ncbi:hypothetical protein [Hymenobacter koreensis]|uniref:hypothetical protein n=1 Tax=Hymenobacter koreensis TaxID=1084523 RepID=UPI0031EC0F26